MPTRTHAGLNFSNEPHDRIETRSVQGHWAAGRRRSGRSVQGDEQSIRNSSAGQRVDDRPVSSEECRSAGVMLTQTITLPNMATLTASANDDGIPEPRPSRNPPGANANPNVPDTPPSRREKGLQIKWTFYRGPGKFRFDPDTSPDAYKQPVTLTSKVTFSAPGTYVLQAIASDGQLTSTYNTTVTVNPK